MSQSRWASPRWSWRRQAAPRRSRESASELWFAMPPISRELRACSSDSGGTARKCDCAPCQSHTRPSHPWLTRSCNNGVVVQTHSVLDLAAEWSAAASPRLHEDEHVEGRSGDGRRLRRGDAHRVRGRDADHGQVERAACVNAAGDRGAVEVCGILHHVAVTHIEDARDVYADRTLLRPIVDDDVGPTRLILVGAQNDLDPRGGATCICARIGEPVLRPPAVEGGDVSSIVAPHHGCGVAEERIVAPPLVAVRPKGPHHAAAGKVVQRWSDNTLDRKSTRLNSSHSSISYAVFCLKKKTNLMALERP